MEQIQKIEFLKLLLKSSLMKCHPFVAICYDSFQLRILLKIVKVMVMPKWTLASLAPSLHWAWVNWFLNAKRAPEVSIFFDELPLTVNTCLQKWRVVYYKLRLDFYLCVEWTINPKSRTDCKHDVYHHLIFSFFFR